AATAGWRRRGASSRSPAIWTVTCSFHSRLRLIAVVTVEELDGDRGELVVELEDAAVSGVGVDGQLGALDAPVQVLGESRGHHPVVVAVGDESGLGELRQVVGRAAAPLLDRLQLRLERLHLDLGVTVGGALLEPVDERARGGLAGGVA